MNSNTNQRNKSEDDEDGEGRPVFVPVRPPYQTYESVRQQRITDFYLTKSIGAPDEYCDMIHKIRTACAADIIQLHLNTPGGRLDTGIAIINAMKESEARIITVLESKAYSLGTLIFLAGDEYVIHENSMFMIHNYSSVTGGKGNEQKAELMATEAWFKKLAEKYYVPFLSKEELEKVLNGHDMWMDSDEVKRRLKIMVKIQQAEIDAANGVKPRAAPGRRKSDKQDAVDVSPEAQKAVEATPSRTKKHEATASTRTHIVGAYAKSNVVM